MFDIYMRAVKDAIVKPFLAFVATQKFSPNYITALSGIVGIIGVVFSALDQRYTSFLFYTFSRILDGVDGAYARLTN